MSFRYNEYFQNKVTESKIVKLWIIAVGTSYGVSVTNVYLVTIWIPVIKVSIPQSNQYKTMSVLGREGKNGTMWSDLYVNWLW